MGATEKQLENLTEELKEEIVEESKEGVEENLIAESFVEESQEKLEKEESLEKPEKEELEESEEKSPEESKARYKKIAIGIIISLCSLLIIYFVMVKYFTNRFYYGSAVNSISVSGRTVEDAKAEASSQLQNYTLELKERGDKREQIQGSEIGLKYNMDEELRELKDRQNPYKWVFALFTIKDSKMTVEFSYDEVLLKERIEQLSCFDSSKIIEPESPRLQYIDDRYVIIEEVHGNKVDRDVLYSQVADSIRRGETVIDLEALGCYIEPEYDSNAQEVLKAKDVLNKYVSSKITYTFGEGKEILDGSIINRWLTVDENFQVIIDKKQVEEYIALLSKAYDTIGKTRSFVTTPGKTVNISGGDYGWAIDQAKETEDLITAIKEGNTLTKEPIHRQTAFARGNNDIGNTYVEIDLSKQYLWFYKDGALVVEGKVVTGNVSKKHSTPKGIYRLKYKQRNVVLRGPGYAAPVTFWMPFNGGIGIHDASWRSVFGGNIYLTNGSHGCVNAPYNVAREIFNAIEEDTPIICY